MRETAIVEALARGRVLILGDVMVDHYVVGSIERISPEAPVPVLQVTDERWVLGGAANVAANISALGGKAELAGVVGRDAMGELLLRRLGELGVDSAVELQDQPTIVKTRYVSGQQQVVRVDRERRTPPTPDVERRVVERLAASVNECDAVVLSDYGKGFLTDRIIRGAIDAAKQAGKPIFVDPKRKSFTDYAGASVITPNRRELMEATGLPCASDEEAAAAAAVAMKASGAAILLTRSERGMSLFRAGAAPIHLAAHALEVFDVSGAGDTVIAGAALATAAGLSLEDAIRIANAAAGVVVGKRGTATCSPRELVDALSRGSERHDAPDHLGLTPIDRAIEQRAQWRREGLQVGFTNGCFDLIHPGHVSLLRQAAAACDRLIVAINTDDSVKRLKGPTRPVQAEEARGAVLAAIRGVDLVVSFAEDTPARIIEQLAPDVLVKGADYREDQVVGAEFVKARGGRVVLADLAPGHSTTSMVERAGR